MKLTDQVASLELCKRLKELNVPQHSYFYWAEIFFTKEITAMPQSSLPIATPGTAIAAFTVAELGEMLPSIIGTKRLSSDRATKDNDGLQPIGWFCGYSENGIWQYELRAFSESEADARAKMLIYCIENNLVNISAGMEAK